MENIKHICTCCENQLRYEHEIERQQCEDCQIMCRTQDKELYILWYETVKKIKEENVQNKFKNF